MVLHGKPINDTSAIIMLIELIHRLSEQQSQALKRPTFVGMTRDEPIKQDSDRCRIRTLIGS